MNIRFNGLALYFLSVKDSSAFILALALSHLIPSIPAVLFPLFCVTPFIANAFA